MKKALSLILALVMCVSLCACGAKNSSDTTPTTLPTTENSTLQEPQNEPEEKHVMTEAETFAAKMLIAGAKGFLNPLSVKVKNVWVSSINDSFYHFTFELEVKNSAGNMESVYYGTNISITDLSNASLEKVIDDIKTCNTLTALGNKTSSMYFRENKIEAMQKGTALDAESIQEYFLMNYK